MSTFIGLAKLTDQGLRSIKETTKRSDAVKEMARKYGVRVREILWAQGQYDIITLCDADDELSASAFSLAVASAGNVRFETLRTFTRDEMDAILQKM